jgi:hypothetical protein
MPDLGRHETGLAIESAWTYLLRAEGFSAIIFTGEFRVDQEIPEKYCQVVCTEIVPANSLAFDKIEICTVEIRLASSKNVYNSPTSIQHWRDKMIGRLRSILFYTENLAAYLETGLAKRGPSTTTSNEPLKIFHALYQTQNMSYYNIDDPHYDIRVARLQTVVG